MPRADPRRQQIISAAEHRAMFTSLLAAVPLAAAAAAAGCGTDAWL